MYDVMFHIDMNARETQPISNSNQTPISYLYSIKLEDNRDLYNVRMNGNSKMLYFKTKTSMRLFILVLQNVRKHSVVKTVDHVIIFFLL